MLNVENVSIGYGDHVIVKDVSFTVNEGEWLMLVGPNGTGKSTLVGAIGKSLPYSGRIMLEGRDIKTIKTGEYARNVGVMAQHNMVGYAYTVEEVVALGRYAYAKGVLGGKDTDAEALIEQALEMTGLTRLRDHSVMRLSGGELQRTFLAQTLVQDPKVLLLDEPANHLDLIYQKHIFTVIRDWLKQPGRAVISVVHDLSLAKMFGTHALLLEREKSATYGLVKDVINAENLQRVYNMDVYAWMHEMYAQWKDD